MFNSVGTASGLQLLMPADCIISSLMTLCYKLLISQTLMHIASMNVVPLLLKADLNYSAWRVYFWPDPCKQLNFVARSVDFLVWPNPFDQVNFLGLGLVHGQFSLCTGLVGSIITRKCCRAFSFVRCKLSQMTQTINGT